MFRVLERATEGHGYEVITCWLTGPKAGMCKTTVDLKIQETQLRAKSDDLCEYKLAGGLWLIASKKTTEGLIEELNTIRKKKGWPLKTFKRLEEWLHPQDRDEAAA